MGRLLKRRILGGEGNGRWREAGRNGVGRGGGVRSDLRGLEGPNRAGLRLLLRLRLLLAVLLLTMSRVLLLRQDEALVVLLSKQLLLLLLLLLQVVVLEGDGRVAGVRV